MKVSPELTHTVEFAARIARRAWKPVLGLMLVGGVLGYVVRDAIAKERVEVTTIVKVGQIAANTPIERLPTVLGEINVGSGGGQNPPSIKDEALRAVKGDRSGMDVRARAMNTETYTIGITGIAPTAGDATRLTVEATKLLISKHAKLYDYALGWKKKQLEGNKALRADLERHRQALSQIGDGEDSLQMLARAIVASNVGVQIMGIAEMEGKLIREISPPAAFPTEVVNEAGEPVRKMMGSARPLFAGLLLGLVLGLAWAIRAEG